MSVTITRWSEYATKAEGRHRAGLGIAAAVYLAVFVAAAMPGASYYLASRELRAFSPLNAVFRPSGPVGMRLALVATASFSGIYLYAIRKKWKWLARQGKTRNWLDLHIIMGTAAPVLITLHAGFRTRGLAGIAYWMMMIVALSGFVGRYLYSQVPRRLNAAELSLREMQEITDEIEEQLHSQSMLPARDLQPILAVPSKKEVEAMALIPALLLMIAGDLRRPFRVAHLRRHAVKGAARFGTLWGLLPSHQAELERVIALARRRSWMAAKISFLAKTQRVFHLWHVIHKPFSYSFAILACVHIGFELFIGYY